MLDRISRTMVTLPERSRSDRDGTSWNTTPSSTTLSPILVIPLPPSPPPLLFLRLLLLLLPVVVSESSESSSRLAVALTVSTAGMLDSWSCRRRCSPVKQPWFMDLMGLPSRLSELSLFSPENVSDSNTEMLFQSNLSSVRLPTSRNVFAARAATALRRNDRRLSAAYWPKLDGKIRWMLLSSARNSLTLAGIPCGSWCRRLLSTRTILTFGVADSAESSIIKILLESR